jgi:hypothetical protein
MSYILSVYELILVSAKLQIGKRGKKKQNWLGEVQQGGEGPHWTAGPSKKKKKKKKKKKEEEEEEKKSYILNCFYFCAGSAYAILDKYRLFHEDSPTEYVV